MNMREIIELAMQAIMNAPVVGGVYDQQHSDTQQAAYLALKALLDFEPIVLVGVEGGIVQGASSNLDLDVVVFDYDIEDEYEVPQSGGDFARAGVSAFAADVDTVFMSEVKGFVEHIEDVNQEDAV